MYLEVLGRYIKEMCPFEGTVRREQGNAHIRVFLDDMGNYHEQTVGLLELESRFDDFVRAFFGEVSVKMLAPYLEEERSAHSMDTQVSDSADTIDMLAHAAQTIVSDPFGSNTVMLPTQERTGPMKRPTQRFDPSKDE